MKPVESSNISHIGFEPSRDIHGKLRVRFKNGSEWEYDKVSALQHQQLMEAESKGSWVATHLVRKPHTHPARKIKG